MHELLSDDHRELDNLLQRFYRTLDTSTALDIYEKLDIFWARLAMHIRAEHLHLFPAILKAVETKNPARFENVQEAVTKLHSDHDFLVRELAAAVRLMREQITDGEEAPEKMAQVREKVDDVHKLLVTHNEIEESEVYQWAEEFIEPSKHEALRRSMQNELNRLPPRFDGDRDGSRCRNYD